MATAVQGAARIIRVGKETYSRKWSFLVLSLLVFAVSVYSLARLDLLPDPIKAPAVTLASTPVLASSTPIAQVAVTEEPIKIEIPSIALSATIANPISTTISILDEALLKGAVRYPTSAKLNQDGNVVLFGHSSYLPIVNNLAYKTFDGIQKLKVGDTITVYSSDTAYVYAVESVAKMNADSGDGIPLQVQGRKLTLATCNSFATKSDRFVVTAHFVESHPFTTP